MLSLVTTKSTRNNDDHYETKIKKRDCPLPYPSDQHLDLVVKSILSLGQLLWKFTVLDIRYYTVRCTYGSIL